MERKRIGFIGFGEVGKAFSKALETNGAEVFYYDLIRKELEIGVTFLPLRELIETCEILLCTVVSHTAMEVAQGAAKHLCRGKTYADLNSTSPSVKIRIGQVIEETGSDFIEGAILSAVGESGSRATILVSGKNAEDFSLLMNRFGLVNLRYLSARIGDASTIKMIRSIFSKGVEGLLLEMLIAARSAGVEEMVWKEVVGTMREDSFRSAAENWIRTHPVACERRYHEMVQVIETLMEMNIEPLMTLGTKRFFERSSGINWGEGLREKPEDFRSVHRFMEEYLKREKGGGKRKAEGS